MGQWEWGEGGSVGVGRGIASGNGVRVCQWGWGEGVPVGVG
jgi:hypothetical protein